MNCLLVVAFTIFVTTMNRFMNNTKALEQINTLLDTWKGSLDSYSDEDFVKKPDTDSWSIGQVYQHLAQSTLNFHLQQVKASLETVENEKHSKTKEGFMSFKVLGALPPIKIKVPPSEFYTPSQPKDRASILEAFEEIRVQMKSLSQEIQTTISQGKTKHPGLGYLNASEWFQLIPMHFKHHLRQKKRLDKFLGK